MCMYSDILDSRIWENYETNIFFIFWYGFKIKTSVYAWTCDEQPRTYEEHIRKFKNIQTYSRELNSYYHVREINYTFIQDPYNGGGDSW